MVIFSRTISNLVASYIGAGRLGKERLFFGLTAALVLGLSGCSSDVVLGNDVPPGNIPEDAGDGGPGPGNGASDAATGASDGRADAAAPSGLHASLAVVDFEKVPCGSSAPGRSFSLANTGTATTAWSVALRRGDPFQISGPTAGSLAAGASVQIALIFTAPTGVRSASAFNDALLIDDSDDATTDEQITVRAQVSGADLVFTTAVVNFGTTDIAGPARSRAIALENRGDLAATIAFDQQSQGPFALFFVGGGNSLVLAPGAATSGIRADFQPTVEGLAAASFTLMPSGAICTAPSDSLDLSGEGISSDLRTSEPELDFGLVGCGTAASPRTVTLSNAGTAPVSYTLALVKGAASPFTLSRANGTLAAGASQALIVTPKPVPAPAASAVNTSANAFGDVLTITEPGGTVHTMDLLQTARGAVFSVLPASVVFPSTVVGNERDYNINLDNLGSGRARVQYTITPVNGPFRSTRPLGPIPVDAADSLVDTITFEPLSAGSFSATLTWTLVPVAGEVLCAPMPASIAISAVATAAPPPPP